MFIHPLALILFVTLFVLMVGSLIWLNINYRQLQRMRLKLSHQLKRVTNKINKDSDLSQNQAELKNEIIASSANKTRYLSGISHELRTPLNVIMGYTQLLHKQATADDPNKDKYALMHHNCEHLNHLVEGILEFSAIEAGKLKVQFEVVDLHVLINQLTTMFNHQAIQKGITFSSHVDNRLPKTVKTDHKRLNQILMNLLSNAIKFTEKGHIEFNTSYRNQVATFSIKDSGRGIETSDLGRIFEPFERIEQSDKPIKGTGLGLPITRLLVDLLGGELKVDSQISHGSEFTVKLMLAPLSHSTNHQFKTEKNFSQNKTINQQQNTLHHILVVDDEKSHRDLLIEILQPHQFKISTAADAKEAKNLIQQQDFSLAIIDVSMPKINGWQLAQWLRSNSHKTKIMMLSANPRDAEASSDKPYDNYLTKPIKINQLMSDINHLLDLGWKQAIPASIQSNNLSHVKLPDENQSALVNMLEIGHINGIESYLKKLTEQQVINEQQHQQLLKPVKNMNLNAFKEMIKHEQ